MTEESIQSYIASLPDHQPGIALDIGASVGPYTGLLATKFEHVHAFEPEQTNLRILAQRFSAVKNVTIERSAVGWHDDLVRLYYSTAPGCHTISQNEQHRKEWGFIDTWSDLVPSITLDTFYRNHPNIRFMKVDTEGAEEYLFYEGLNLLTNNKLQILLELHVNVDIPRLFNFFKLLNYRVYDLDTMRETFEGFSSNWHWLIRNDE